MTERRRNRHGGSSIGRGSMAPVVHRVTHAGIVETRKWSFSID
jgi:hypothetical protein